MDKKQEEIKPEVKQPVKWRQILIETDGNTIKISKVEISTLELKSILEKLLESIQIKITT